MSYTVEHSIRIYDDNSGEYIYIGPDADGLDLFELRYVMDEKICNRISFTKEQAKLVADAIYELLSMERPL